MRKREDIEDEVQEAIVDADVEVRHLIVTTAALEVLLDIRGLLLKMPTEPVPVKVR